MTARRSRFRFSLKLMLIATGAIAIALWLVPEVMLELKWRPKRLQIIEWAEQIDRSDGYNHIQGVQSDAQYFAIATKPVYFSSRLGGTISDEFPDQQEFNILTDSPFGPNTGFFIIPQCVWVESPEDAVKIWKRTTTTDWDRYHSISPHN